MLDARARRSSDGEAMEAIREQAWTHVREDQVVPYWQQGNLDLYSEQRLRERLALRRHAEVLRVLQMWWNAVQYSLRTSQDADASRLREWSEALLRAHWRIASPSTRRSLPAR